jgi:hypothetical protein
LIKWGFEIGAMKILHKLFRAPPTSANISALGDGKTGNTNVSLMTLTGLNDEIKSMMEKAPPIPKFVEDLWKRFLVIYQVASEFKKAASDIIYPAQYFTLLIPYVATTTIQGYRGTVVDNIIKSEKFMNQFGVPFSTFKEEMIEPQLKSYNPSDPDMIAIFSDFLFQIYGDATAVNIGHYVLSADGSENHEWYFKGDKGPNESDLHELSKLTYARQATYNKYGDYLNI